MAVGASFSHLVRETVVWVMVLGTGFAGVFYFDDLRGLLSDNSQTVAAAYRQSDIARENTSAGFERSVTLKAGRNGHFFARAYINGQPIAVLVDTGATGIALTYEDARRIGILVSDGDYSLTTRTANGIARAAPVSLDRVRIGEVEVNDLKGTIAEEGKLHITLLGMEFIRRLERFEMRGRELVLVQ